MDDNLTAVLIVLISVLGPIWIVFHYRAKGQKAGMLSASDAAVVDGLNQTAVRLEQRVAALERILDVEVPAWRAGFEEIGERNDRKVG
jgi:phage shock protein B